MVDFIDDDQPPPSILETAFLCRKWNSLPEAGAVYDQDYGTITRMSAVLNVYDTVSKLRRAKGDQIHQLSASQLRLIEWLRENRMI